MAKTVQILVRHRPNVGGFNIAGTPKQGKTMVWGQITISSYADVTTGEPLSPNDLGLTTVDYMHANVVSVQGTAIVNVEANTVYLYGTGALLVFEAAGDTLDAADTAVLRFFAVGDSANDVESIA